MSALHDWRLWVLCGLLASASYVQSVGKSFEMLSGLDRTENPEAYCILFGGAPWIQWPLYKYSGAIQIACYIVAFFMFGWLVGLVIVVATPVFLSLTWRTCRRHAGQMVANIQRQMLEEGDGPLARAYRSGR